jgi:serine protein kinase
VILLHGPVGSSKSTIARLLKRGLEHYSRTPRARSTPSPGWTPRSTCRRRSPAARCPARCTRSRCGCCPRSSAAKFLDEVNQRLAGDRRIAVEGELCPACRHVYNQLLQRYDGDWTKVIEHVRVRRLLLSEQDRVGIGTFQPKDEKNQDSTELTGDINYRKIAEYGSDSDPRAFNFDGEFNIANRGMIEFIEVLKLDVAFLYDLLGASQEHKIKPKKFAQTDIDEVIIGHTNEPEYRRLQNNEFMEALRDRTVKIDIPYITKLDEEIKIYERDFNSAGSGQAHRPAHHRDRRDVGGADPAGGAQEANLTLLQKLKLYNGKTLPGFTEDNVKELRKEAEREGMDGDQPALHPGQDLQRLVADIEESCVNPFMVMKELESGLKHHSLITSEEQRERTGSCSRWCARSTRTSSRTRSSARSAATRTRCSGSAPTTSTTSRRTRSARRSSNKYTGEYEEPDERLMRSIEEKIDIPESRKDDFRREIMNYIGALAIDGKRSTTTPTSGCRRRSS